MDKNEQAKRSEQASRLEQLQNIIFSKKDQEAYMNLEMRTLGKITILNNGSPEAGIVQTRLKELIDDDVTWHKDRRNRHKNYHFHFSSLLNRYIADVEYENLDKGINFNIHDFDKRIMASHDNKLIEEYQNHGGVQYLNQLLSIAGGVANDVDGVMRSLMTTAKRRYTVDNMSRVLASIDPNSDDIEDIESQLSEINRRVIELGSDGSDQPVRVTETGSEWLNMFYQTRMMNGNLVGLPTGFKQLDEKIGGFRPGQMIVIGARPAVGKTAFSLELASNFVAADTKEQLNGIYFSLEMNRLELFDRLIARETLIDGNKIKQGNVNDYEWMEIIDQLQNGDLNKWGNNIYIDENPSLTIDEIEERIQAVSQKVRHLDFVFVDYMQLISANNENRQQAVANISRRLKIIAKKYQTTVFALSQLKRGSIDSDTGRPVLSDLRESGQIEQDADVVIMLSVDKLFAQEEGESQGVNGGDVQNSNAEEIVALEIVKNRSGERGLIYYTAHRPYSRFTEMSEEDLAKIRNDVGNHDDHVISNTTSSFDNTVNETPTNNKSDVPGEKQNNDDFPLGNVQFNDGMGNFNPTFQLGDNEY